MGKNNSKPDYFLLRSEVVSIKAPITMADEEGIEASRKLEAYFDRVFEKAFEEVLKAFPNVRYYRNGVLEE
jgi:hypothetical protein